MSLSLLHACEVLIGGRTTCQLNWASPKRPRGPWLHFYRPVTTGGFLISEHGDELPLHTDRLHVFPGQIPSGYGCHQSFTIDWFHLAVNDAPLSASLSMLPLATSIKRDAIAAADQCFAQYCRDLRRPQSLPRTAVLALHGAILQVFAEIVPDQTTALNSQLQAALHWLSQHDAEPLDIRRLANDLEWSVVHLRRQFRRQFGQTVQAYHDQLRMLRARRLLINTDKAIADVALACGWDDPQYFSRVFKKATGHAPSVWRGNVKP